MLAIMLLIWLLSNWADKHEELISRGKTIGYRWSPGQEHHSRGGGSRSQAPQSPRATPQRIPPIFSESEHLPRGIMTEAPHPVPTRTGASILLQNGVTAHEVEVGDPDERPFGDATRVLGTYSIDDPSFDMGRVRARC